MMTSYRLFGAWLPGPLYLQSIITNIRPLQCAPTLRPFQRVHEVLHCQNCLRSPPLLTDSSNSSRQDHEDSGDLLLFSSLSIPSLDFTKKAPNALIDNLSIPDCVYWKSHRGTECYPLAPPTVYTLQLLRDLHKGTCSRWSETSPFVIERFLCCTNKNIIVMPRGLTQGPGYSIVEGPV